MTYYARNSWDAKELLLKVNGHQSDTLILNVNDDGYTLCDPINKDNIVIINNDEYAITEEG